MEIATTLDLQIFNVVFVIRIFASNKNVQYIVYAQHSNLIYRFQTPEWGVI